MLLLHKTEAEIEEGMSPYIIERLAWVMAQDAEHEAAERAHQEADQRLKEAMSGSVGGGRRPTRVFAR